MLKLTVIWLCCLIAIAPAGAFEVVKNVNSGVPPQETLVLFDKSAAPSADSGIRDRKNNAAITRTPGGELSIGINRSGETELVFPLPQTLDITRHNYLLLTCRFAGRSRNSWQGKWGPWTPYTGTKLWYGACFLDNRNQRTAAANLDSVSPDGFLPTKTVTLRIPLVLMKRQGLRDPTRATAFLLVIGGVRSTVEREFVLTIDKVAIAD